MKKLNLQNMVIKEGKETQTNSTDNLFNTIIAGSILTSRKRKLPRCRKLTEHQTTRTKRGTPPDIIIKTLSMQNKERILKATKEKRQVTYKDKRIRIIADFSPQTVNT
jgi:hypothetical protein